MEIINDLFLAVALALLILFILAGFTFLFFYIKEEEFYMEKLGKIIAVIFLVGILILLIYLTICLMIAPEHLIIKCDCC